MWRRKTGPESIIFIVPTMTAARQQRKAFALAWPWTWTALLGLVLAGGFPERGSAQAAPLERTVVNPNSGLGLSGFDPVAYFTDSKPVIGKPELEFTRSGAVWRFANEGNRAAFVDHPDVYMPRFGGFDPVAIARGTSVAGHPLYWSVEAGRLYLFYNEAARAAFAVDPGRYIETAERKWPEVARAIGQ
jgi:YHS domain-containing protein